MKKFLRTLLTLTALTFTACNWLGIDSQSEGQVNGTVSGNPGEDSGVRTGAALRLDFPKDPNNADFNGPLLQGVEGSTTTFRVRFVSGKVPLPGGETGETTSLTSMSVTASEEFGGLTTSPFLDESDMQAEGATFKITTPPGRQNKSRIITIRAFGRDSGGAILRHTTTLLVNTTTILTTNPEYTTVTEIRFPDLNPLTTDTIKLRFNATLNQDMILTGVGELVDEPAGRYPADRLPLYIPLAGRLVLKAGERPLLQSFPIDQEFPPGTVNDLPGQEVKMKNFCIETAIEPDLTSFSGLIRCASGDPVQTDLSGLPGLLFTVQGSVTGTATTPVQITDPARGLNMDVTQITTGVDLDPATIDIVRFKIKGATTQPDLSLKGRLELVHGPNVDPNEPTTEVDFETFPVDLTQLVTQSKPISIRLPEGNLDDLKFPVFTKNTSLTLNLSEDFRFNYGTVAPGGKAATAIAEFDLLGTSFSRMTEDPILPTDPGVKADANPMAIFGTANQSADLVVTFKPGDDEGSPTSVSEATITPIGPAASFVTLAKTALNAADFQNNIANIPVSVNAGIDLTTAPAIVGFKIEGTDSAQKPFKGYGALTLRQTQQPALPNPPAFDLTQYTTKPDIILSTADRVVFRTNMTATYGGPGEMVMSGTATLIYPPNITLVIPTSSTFNAKTRGITTSPITARLPKGALLDLAGVRHVDTVNVSFTGTLSPDLKTGTKTINPGAQAIMPNGVVNSVEGVGVLKAVLPNTNPDLPQLAVEFYDANPVIWGIVPGDNSSNLRVTFTPGLANGAATTLTSISCKSDSNFDVLRVTNFATLAQFQNNVANYHILPDPTYDPHFSKRILVSCEAIDSAGQRASNADVLIYSNSPFQPPIPLPNFELQNFNVDPETESATPPINKFPNDGLRFVVRNQMMTPGITLPTISGESVLTHFTWTQTFGPNGTAIWAPYDIGAPFILPTSGVANMVNLTLKVEPFGTWDTVSNNCSSGQVGWAGPGRPVCFPAGLAQEDSMPCGNYPNRAACLAARNPNVAGFDLVVGMSNFALFGQFEDDLRTMYTSSALSCSAFLGCTSPTAVCPLGTGSGFGVACQPNDYNPNPFFPAASKVHALPPFTIPIPLNSFGTATQCSDPSCPVVQP